MQTLIADDAIKSDNEMEETLQNGIPYHHSGHNHSLTALFLLSIK